MDCRRTLGLGLGLLIGAAGCTSPGNGSLGPKPGAPVLPQAQAQAPAAVEEEHVTSLPPGAVVKKAADLPPRMPKPETPVAAGDWYAQEALADPSATGRQEKQKIAREAYEQALKIDPHYLPAYLSLANLYASMNDHAHADETYHRAAQAFPKEPRVFFEMGRCYGAEQKWDESIAALARAAELEPENRQYVKTLGWTQARAGRFDESLATFRKVYDEPEAHYQLALMLEHLGQKDLCRQHLQAALQDPHMDQAKALLAKLDAPPADEVQPAAYVTSAKPPTGAGSGDPAPTAVAADEGAPAAKGVLLPPPPHIPIRYEDPAAPPALPPLPGPVQSLSNGGPTIK